MGDPKRDGVRLHVHKCVCGCEDGGPDVRPPTCDCGAIRHAVTGVWSKPGPADEAAVLRFLDANAEAFGLLVEAELEKMREN